LPQGRPAFYPRATELKIIDVFICKLRKKLANASNGKNYIETVWGRGYVLCEPVETQEKIPA
jgi:two-component system, cell cycle response regulator CtrA